MRKRHKVILYNFLRNMNNKLNGIPLMQMEHEDVDKSLKLKDSDISQTSLEPLIELHEKMEAERTRQWISDFNKITSI